MKLFSLSIVLGSLLFASASPVLAMEDGEMTQLASLPRFPLDQYGENIDQQDYAISGQGIKQLAANPSQTSPARLNGLTDDEVYLGFGVTATNLRDYHMISDNTLYFVNWRNNQEKWSITGNIPNSLKWFTVEIDTDYAP